MINWSFFLLDCIPELGSVGVGVGGGVGGCVRTRPHICMCTYMLRPEVSPGQPWCHLQSLCTYSFKAESPTEPHAHRFSYTGQPPSPQESFRLRPPSTETAGTHSHVWLYLVGVVAPNSGPNACAVSTLPSPQPQRAVLKSKLFFFSDSTATTDNPCAHFHTHESYYLKI